MERFADLSEKAPAAGNGKAWGLRVRLWTTTVMAQRRRKESGEHSLQ